MPTDAVADDDANIRVLGQSVIETEAAAVAALGSRIDDHFVQACRLLLNCTGRIVVSGVGKSGHIGSKIAATLSSTGSPAFFVHPAEACHGDLGMIKGEDIFLAISYSGRSDELMTILPILKRQAIPLIAMTGVADSPLANAATVRLDISVEKEACPLGLAPTASTSATLAMGDALAIALLGVRGFGEDDFALSHPGGSLGRKLLLRTADVMVKGDAMPTVKSGTLLSRALIEISEKGLGMTTVVTEQKRLLGIFTDGDLRRTIDRDDDVRTIAVDSVMTAGGQTVSPDALAATAVSLMQQHRISALPVVDELDRLCGVVTMHMLLAAGVV
ncbi:MAG: KpsF/GutQ family sugar-phosphate isomerase [Gammaproteobacteria bacterium]|nr:KpsF/GutQ family sugar-phosphate isomerase [Gammaproteobacteria bacterium]